MNNDAMLQKRPDDFSPELGREVLRCCGSFNLRKAARSVTQLFDDILQPTGLRSTQVALLVVLAVEHELSLTRLARELVLSPSTLSRNLQPLERDGLIETYGIGKRGRFVRLTPQGRGALLDAVPYWRRAQEKFTSLIGVQAWEDLTQRLTATLTATRT